MDSILSFSLHSRCIIRAAHTHAKAHSDRAERNLIHNNNHQPIHTQTHTYTRTRIYTSASKNTTIKLKKKNWMADGCWTKYETNKIRVCWDRNKKNKTKCKWEKVRRATTTNPSRWKKKKLQSKLCWELTHKQWSLNRIVHAVTIHTNLPKWEERKTKKKEMKWNNSNNLWDNTWIGVCYTEGTHWSTNFLLNYSFFFACDPHSIHTETSKCSNWIGWHVQFGKSRHFYLKNEQKALNKSLLCLCFFLNFLLLAKPISKNVSNETIIMYVCIRFHKHFLRISDVNFFSVRSTRLISISLHLPHNRLFLFFFVFHFIRTFGFEMFCFIFGQQKRLCLNAISRRRRKKQFQQTDINLYI